MFRQATQEPSETMEMYVSRHKRLIRTCNYGILSDEMICDQVLEKCYSARLQHRLHLEETLTLDVVFNTRAIARAIEASDCQAQKNHPTSSRHIQPRADTSQEFRPDPPANQTTTPN